jgi:hypothetical protein
MSNENILEKQGYVFLKHVFDREVLLNFNNNINQYFDKYGIFFLLNKRIDYNNDIFYINNTYSQLDNFYKIQYYRIPVINNRTFQDAKINSGIIDIYNFDKLFPEVYEIFRLETLLTILEELSGIKWKLFRTNLQIHNNVKNPMSFHIDNYGVKNIKITIYLTDILSNEDGACSYIEGTHIRDSSNRVKSINKENTKYFCGEIGDLLISYQNGFHRKLPQLNNTVNSFLVFNFVPL